MFREIVLPSIMAAYDRDSLPDTLFDTTESFESRPPQNDPKTSIAKFH